MGAKIAKHGNRSVSSKSGASDVLTALGVNVNVTPEQARQALDEIGVCFYLLNNIILASAMLRQSVPL